MENFLDPAFQAIKENHDGGERRTIAKWVEVVATSISEGTETIEDVIYSLCDKKILKQEKKSTLGMFTQRRWPAGSNDAAKAQLTADIRGVILDGNEASPFLRALLRFVRLADGDFVMRNPFIDKVLHSKLEKQRAAEMLKQFDELPGEKKSDGEAPASA